MSLFQYPERLTRQQDGSYRWTCRIGLDYHRSQAMLAMKICLGIAVFLLAFGAFAAYSARDLEQIWIVALCVVVFLAIAAFFTRLYGWGIGSLRPDPRELYEMTEEHVKTGFGKTAAYFRYARVKVLVIRPDYLELRSRRSRVRVYAPEEDMAFVRDYIRRRVPGDAEVRFDGEGPAGRIL
ncbi:MAG: hypothetical protein IK095_08605 [Oscillospiraceae bacterium]|nr:hypothetical protein [Oscillospiraceae bacterium]